MAVRQGDLAKAVAATVPDRLVGEAVGVVEAASGNLEAWFTKVADRVSQRFTMWMRIWTVLFAFTISFACCLDAFRLLSELYKNGDLRAQLVSAAPQVTDIAKRIIPPGSTTPEDAVTKDLTSMYTEALQKAVKDATIEAKVPNLASSAQASVWIDQNVPEAQRAALRRSFESNWEAQMASHVQDAEQVRAVLSAANLLTFGWSERTQSESLLWRVLGVLTSAFLLSLGAPFWYNALATLTNLRPVLVSKRQSQDQAKLASQAQSSN